MIDSKNNGTISHPPFIRRSKYDTSAAGTNSRIIKSDFSDNQNINLGSE
jgi:hypothetical protein